MNKHLQNAKCLPCTYIWACMIASALPSITSRPPSYLPPPSGTSTSYDVRPVPLVHALSTPAPPSCRIFLDLAMPSDSQAVTLTLLSLCSPGLAETLGRDLRQSSDCLTPQCPDLPSQISTGRSCTKPFLPGRRLGKHMSFDFSAAAGFDDHTHLLGSNAQIV